MPPKRKKSVRQKQKQRQSQSQKVIVNVGKTTPRKRRTTGRGRLPPPSYQQNLFPPTIIQQQAPNIAVLENQISRLTSLIQPTQPIQNLNTPLSNTQVQQMAAEKAEERRAGPTASNFQAQPSKADFDLPDPLTGGPSDVSTLSGPSLPAGFNEDESVQTTKPDESLQDEQAEAFKQQLLKQKKEKEFGGSSLPPSNTIKQDDSGVKKSPPQTTITEELSSSKPAEEDRSDRMVSDAMDAEELMAERQKLYSKALNRLPRRDLLEGDPTYNPKIITGLKNKLGTSFLRQLLEENRKELEPKPKKVSRKKASASSDEDFGRD